MGRASYLGMLRVKLLRSLNDCLALGARSVGDSNTAEDEDAASSSTDTYRVQRTCCFGACQKKVINVERHLERRHHVPVSKSGDLAQLTSLLSKYKRPCDVPSWYALHYMKEPNSGIAETVDETSSSSSSVLATSNDAIAQKWGEELFKATKIYRDVVLSAPTRSRPTIPYREMMADVNSDANRLSSCLECR